MSVKVMGAVWDLDLPHPKKYVLLALADHADHDGANARPSVALLAHKTGYSERQVQRVLDALEADALICPEGSTAGGRGRATSYRITPENGVKTSPFRDKGRQVVTHSPVKGDIQDTERVTSETLKGDISDGAYRTPPRKTEPSLEPSSEPEEKEGHSHPPALFENLLDTPLPRNSDEQAGAQPKPKKARLIHVAENPPALDEVKQLLQKRGVNVCHAVPFLSHYGANGWMQNGGKKVYSWAHALTGWVERQANFGPPAAARASPVASPQPVTDPYAHLRDKPPARQEAA